MIDHNKKINIECRTKKEMKASALVYILVIMSAVTVILVSTIQYVASQIKYGFYEAYREESLQISEAGIYFYRWYLAHEIEGKTAQQIKDFWETGNPYGVDSPYEIEYKEPQGAGIGKFSISVTPAESYSTIVVVESTGWTYKNPDSQRVVKVRFRRPSWSEYAVLSDVEGSYIRFGDGTEIFGPLHANGGIHFDGVAHNTISSSTSTYYDSDFDVEAWKDGVWTAWPGEYNTNMSSDVFLGGKDYPVPSKDFDNLMGDLAVMKQEAIDNSTYFDNSRRGRHIILKTDGTFDIRKVRNYNSIFKNITRYAGSWQNYPIPDNGVIFVEDNIWLEGKVDGKKITIVAADLIGGGSPNIFIEHDIEYTNYDGTDIIGIIAEKDIEIIRDSENDLRIDGALVAQNGRVGRDYYSLKKYWWGWGYCPCGQTSCEDHRDTITVFGSIATSERYGFAWGDTCPRSTGYATRNLLYDNNLLYFPPPYFPTGTEYSLDLWEEL